MKGGKNMDAETRATIQALRQMGNTLGAKAMVAMENTMLNLQKPVKRECPVERGILRASINYKVGLSGGNVVGRLGCNAKYAIWVHQGTGIYASEGGGRTTPWVYTVEDGKHKGTHYTRGQRANPFFRRAIDNNKDNIQTWFSNSLAREMGL